jgi:hypothetical protein
MTTTRRLFLFTAAAAAPAIALPAIALPSPVDATAQRLWAERQVAVERLRGLSATYDAASAKLPAWALPGLDRIDQDGNLCGDLVGWPLDTSITPPPLGCRFVRPSLWRCRKDFDFAARVFALDSAGRKKARATMRARMRAIVARLREQDRLYEELGLTELNRQTEATIDAITSAEDYLHECDDETPNIAAARLMMGLPNDCQQDATASGNGYCGTMAMALVALKGLLPSLSGLIRDHAAFFVSNPTLPLSAMPFVAG